MPPILFRNIVADLVRIKLLTATVLVSVIAFGAAIRPIMQNLLGAEDLLQFVTLASVPMLQFALPFAGAFAGTIVYARLAADNEILAMSSAGLCYRRILMPAIGLGLVLFVAMAILLDAGVPRFWTSMQRLITRDVTRLFVGAVERGEALVIDKTQLYADEVAVIPGSADGIGPTSRLALVGVAAIELGPDGRPVTEFTAELATVDVYRENDSAYLKLLFRNATAYNSEEGALVSVTTPLPSRVRARSRRLERLIAGAVSPSGLSPMARCGWSTPMADARLKFETPASRARSWLRARAQLSNWSSLTAVLLVGAPR